MPAFGKPMTIELGSEASKALGFLQKHAGVSKHKAPLIRWALLKMAWLLREQLKAEERGVQLKVVLEQEPGGAWFNLASGEDLKP